MDLLAVVGQCHNDDPWNDASLTPFLLSPGGAGVQIGFLPQRVVDVIEEDVQTQRTDALIVEQAGNKKAVSIHPALETNAEKSRALQKLVESWRDRNLFPDPLKGWRNELYAVYGPNGKVAFNLERAACALFGLATFGVHATAYTVERKSNSSLACAADAETLQIWVPRRAKTKSTWPGYLDNSVAGGITAGDLPFESMVRECKEEASLASDVVLEGMRQTGVISYFYRTRAGWCQPEVEYTYDILLNDTVQLKPADGEAESFVLMGVDEVMERMRKGEFKPNCALVLIDFLIRHGKLTAENCDCDYVKLVCALHNDLRLPGPR